MNSNTNANLTSQYLDDAQYEVRVAGRFKMGKKIGSGSFGEIFLAVDLQTNKEVAIKFVSYFIFRKRAKQERIGIEKGQKTITYRRGKASQGFRGQK